MIFSRRWGFLFVKNRKVGGTSVEIALAPHCGPADIVTPITPVDELARLDRGGQCQNFTSDPRLEAAYRNGLAKTRNVMARRPRQLDEASTFYNHISLAEIEALLGDEVRGVYSFAVERHPYEKALSMAAMWATAETHGPAVAPGGDPDTLRSILDAVIANGQIKRIRNFPRYMRDGAIAVDRVLEQSRLAQELAEVVADLGIPLAKPLPAAKASQRERAPAAELLRHDQKQAICRLCGPEFRRMGYTP